jgi:hypothetical protein
LAQVSARVGLQALHAPPAVPQAVTTLTLQVTPAQQPPGHDVPSHTQAPAAQRWPAAHALPVPHLQTPPEQLSAVPAHGAQRAPPVPHALVDEAVLQLPFA